MNRPVWTSCDRELPDSDLIVMIHEPGGDEPVWMGFHDGETWRGIDGARVKPTHWQPVPEPPEITAAHSAKAATKGAA